jgi:hypothetical protein
LAEFAIILPTLLVTMFLIVETGRIFQAYVTVQNASREGARYAITGQGGSVRTDNVKTAAMDILAAGLPLLEDASCADFCCDLNFQPKNYCIVVWSKGGYDVAGLPGERVQVQVTYNVAIITPILSLIAPYVPVTGRVEMINEPFGPTGQTHSGVVPPTLEMPPTFTPTHTHTPTATPIPITMDKPLRPGDTIVTGHADTRFGQITIVIRDQTDGQTIGTGSLRADGTFRIPVSPALIGEHTIRAISEYGYDEAKVGAATSTPTWTPTATSTATSTSTASPTATGTSTPTPTNTPTPYNLSVTAGDNQDYTDTGGKLWKADRPYSPGSWGYIGLADPVPRDRGACGSIGGTSDLDLYNSYSQGEFMGYLFDNVTNGTYQITLLFVEPSLSIPGMRIFDVAAEDSLKINDLDIYSQVGKCNAYSRTFSVQVTDRQLEIDFAPVLPDTIVSGIDVSFSAYPPTPTPTSTPTYTPGPTNTPTLTPILPPDLTVSGLSLEAAQPITVCWSPITVTTQISNLSTGPCNQFFWTDLYVRADSTPPEPRDNDGVDWHGLNSLGPEASQTITFTHSFAISDTYYLYTQADSFQFVSETDENNNVGGPLVVDVACEGEPPTPTPTPIPDPHCGDVSGTVWAFIGGQLVVPSDRVEVELLPGEGGLPIAAVLTDDQGRYLFDCVPPTAPGSSYTVYGIVDIDGVPYFGQETGVEVPEDAQVSNVDIILYPSF